MRSICTVLRFGISGVSDLRVKDLYQDLPRFLSYYEDQTIKAPLVISTNPSEINKIKEISDNYDIEIRLAHLPEYENFETSPFRCESFTLACKKVEEDIIVSLDVDTIFESKMIETILNKYTDSLSKIFYSDMRHSLRKDNLREKSLEELRSLNFENLHRNTKYRGFRGFCGVAFPTYAVELVGYLNENLTGYGWEDRLLFLKLKSLGLSEFRERYSFKVFHIWHPKQPISFLVNEDLRNKKLTEEYLEEFNRTRAPEARKLWRYHDSFCTSTKLSTVGGIL